MVSLCEQKTHLLALFNISCFCSQFSMLVLKLLHIFGFCLIFYKNVVFFNIYLMKLIFHEYINEINISLKEFCALQQLLA